MTDPTIVSYNRPIYSEELDDYGNFTFSDYKFYIGVNLVYGEDEILYLDESSGKFKWYLQTNPPVDEKVYYDMVNCNETFLNALNLEVASTYEQDI